MAKLDEALNEVCDTLGSVSRQEKKLKATKEKARAEFFKLATQWITENRPLAILSFEMAIEDFDGLDAVEWVKHNHLGYMVDEVVTHEDGRVHLTISEDPSLQEFKWVANGQVYARQIAQVNSSFDAEQFYEDAMQEGEEELAVQVVKQEIVYRVNEQNMMALLEQKPELMPLFQDYSHPGSLQVKLAAPREAKAGEV